MKKYIKIFVTMLLLCACTHKTISLKEPVTLEFYTVIDCAACQAFKKNAIPYFEEIFEDKVTITIYDLDDEKTEVPYKKAIDSLENFDEEFFGDGPFIYVKNYFGIIGYQGGYEEIIADDIDKSQNNEPLSEELETYRYMVKEE